MEMIILREANLIVQNWQSCALHDNWLGAFTVEYIVHHAVLILSGGWYT